MTCYVLVHGAWHHGELWGPVKSALETRGHEVHTPTVAGLREGDSGDSGLEDAWRSIGQYLVEHDLRDIVLLGHSWGGVVISQVAVAHADRIRRLVFQSAFVPRDGECLLDNVPPFIGPALAASADERGDGTAVMPFPVWRDGFMNDATAEFARETYDRLRPQPLRTFVEPVDMKAFSTLDIPKSFINCTEDNGILQGEWGYHPRMSNRLGYFRLVQLPGGHEVMFTNPELLAAKIEEAGRD